MKMSKFQIVVLIVFIVGIFAGLATLALTKNNSSEQSIQSIEVWGVVPQSLIFKYISEINQNRPEHVEINYTEKNKNNLTKDLVEALALGQGPDAILIPQDMVLTLENKLLTIPFTSVSAKSYKDTFVEQAELYFRNDGILGIPFMIDPMVMYWNRDMYNNAGIATYPKSWEEMVEVNKKITQKDVNANIRKTAIAMGEFSNITNAKEILSLILLQAGNPIVENMESVLSGQNIDSTQNALKFFIGFSNPTSQAYSWNRSLPLSKNYFLSGNLANYFGFASEVNDIKEKNPNLNFDIAAVPQPKNAKNRIDFATMYGFSIVKSSKNPGATLSVLLDFTSANYLEKLIPITYLPPVRRDILAKGNSDPYLTIFYDSALISKNFIDPDSNATFSIFKNMVEKTTSGRSTMSEAISEADNEINLLLQKR